MPGPSTPTGISTTSFPAAWRSCSACQRGSLSIQNENGAKHRVVLEGGSIDVNGAGILLTTEECLLSEVQQRNPGVSRAQLERVFHDYLGIDQVIWLDRGIAGDDTHGHVDDIARFVAPATIVAAVEPDTRDPNHAPLAENLARLKAARTPGWQAVHGRRVAAAAARRLPRPAPAGELCEFLHRQRPGAGAHLPRSQRPRGAEHSGRSFFPAAKSSASTAWT